MVLADNQYRSKRTELTLSEGYESSEQGIAEPVLHCQYCRTGARAFYVSVIHFGRPYRRTLCRECVDELTAAAFLVDFLPCRACRKPGDRHPEDHPFEPTGWPNG
jgi:hypothetical protein